MSYVGLGNELLRYGLLRKIWNQTLKPSRKQENKELIIKIVSYMMNLTCPTSKIIFLLPTTF